MPKELSGGVRAVQAETPKYPKYATLQSRSATFSTWPQCLIQLLEVLINAGFFYTGRGDRVVCFMCGGGLKDWTPTADPWTEHAAKFPHCSFVALHNAATQQYVATQAESGVEQKSATSDARICPKCCTRELGVVFLPCGHMVTCSQCGRDLKTCPLCHSPISQVIEAFLP